MKKTRDDQQPQQQPQLVLYYHLSRKIHMTPWSWQGQGFRPNRTQCHAGPSPRRRDPGKLGWWSRRCNWRVLLSYLDGGLVSLHGSSFFPSAWTSKGDPGKRTSQSIGPKWSERRWNRQWKHPEDFCFLRPCDSVLDRLLQFAYFRSLTSSQLSYLILQVLRIQPSRRMKRTTLCSPSVPSHFRDASVGVLPISTLLGPDAQWSTKDIG